MGSFLTYDMCGSNRIGAIGMLAELADSFGIYIFGLFSFGGTVMTFMDGFNIDDQNIY